MRVAITGPNGRLGSELVKLGCTPLYADITDFKQLHKAINEAGPDVIIHCAAWTDVDACEASPIRAATINTGGTYLLRQVFSGKIVYISTDFVFDGENGPYSEEDKPNPISIYGWSKLGGELVMKGEFLIIRITSPFGHSVKPTIATKIVERLKNGQPLTFPEALTSSPTYLPHLAQGIMDALKLNGILNIAGSRIMPMRVLAQEVAKMWGYDPSLIKAGSPIPAPASRPVRGGLIIEKAVQNKIFIGDPLEGLKEMYALEKMETG